ncbi:MAG: hypothetical protein J0I07_03185 [Myxococcales bacterium]|nr:hypothetical protein [Myxococcales bacterium]
MGSALHASALRCARRWPGRCPTFATGAALALMLHAERATAEEPATPVRIAYSAPPSCPDGQVLFAHVLARTARARAAAPNETARELAVRVNATKGRFFGRLLVPATSEGVGQAREVMDESCDELVEALGFFIALSIDPHATALPSTTVPPAAPSPAPAASEPESEPKSEDASDPPPPTSVPPTSVPPPPSPAATSTVTSSTKVEPQPPRSRPWIERKGPWHFGFGAGATLVGGLAPKVLVGSRGFIDLSREPTGDSVFAPFFSVGAISTATATDITPLGGIAIRWQALVGTACPVEVALSSIAVFRPCSSLEAGQLRGEGIHIRNARRTEGEWVAVGLSGRLSLTVWSALFLEVELGGSAPILWPQFRYTTGMTAFDTAALGARTSLTLALRL